MMYGLTVLHIYNPQSIFDGSVYQICVGHIWLIGMLYHRTWFKILPMPLFGESFDKTAYKYCKLLDTYITLCNISILSTNAYESMII